MTTLPLAEERRDKESRASRTVSIVASLLGRRPNLSDMRSAGVVLAECALGFA